MTKTTLASIRQLIGASHSPSNRFLSVIDESGQIICANTGMLKGLSISNPKTASINFLELLHPVHTADFWKSLRIAGGGASPVMEVFLRHEHPNPMRWQFNLLDTEGDKRTFLCVGHPLMDRERQQRFNKLAASHCQLIVEGLSGIIFQDHKGEIIAVNKKAAAILGTNLEQLYRIDNIEQLWENMLTVTDDNGNQVAFRDAPFLRAASTGLLQKRTLCLQLPNGDTRWVMFNARPLPEDDDNQALILTNIVDVTRERRLSGKLREKNAIIDGFMKSTPHLCWMVDEDTRLQFASDSFFRLFQKEEKKSIGRRISEVVPSVVTEAVYQKHIQVLESGIPSELSHKIKWADGSNFICHINIFPIETASEKKLLGGQAVIIPDDSDLKQELRNANERLLHLSRATTDAIWEWDMQSGNMFRNETLMAMIGYQVDNSRGLSWWLRRIHPEDRNRVADSVRDATESQHQSWQEEYRFKCADGTYKQMRDKGFVVYENGLPVKMIGSLTDISYQRELENKLADEKILQQKKVSETVIHMLEKERSRIGHELHDNVNQLLSTSKLFIDVLQPAADQLQLKEKSINYLLTAIEEIRNLSKELVAPQMNQGSVVDAIGALVEDINLAGKIHFTFINTLDDTDVSAGKRTTLFRIAQEHIKNIIKHSGASETRITLGAAEGQIRLLIRDNGKGFDPQQTYRGLGLASIYERSRFYNGKADIQSIPGNGCVLNVSIPLAD
jgi:PAS domain S-box-containing protein